MDGSTEEFELYQKRGVVFAVNVEHPYAIKLTNSVAPDIEFTSKDDYDLIEGNETSAAYAVCTSRDDWETHPEETTKLKIISNNGDDYILGHYTNLPAYSMYYAASNDGEIYRISDSRETDYTDRLLGIEDPQYSNPRLITNVRTGLSRIWSYDQVAAQFESDNLQAAIQVRDNG